MSTHAAVVSVAPRAPLSIIQVPTIPPTEDEVRLRVEWTASTPFDLHQHDGGLFADHPQVLGANMAGTVVEVGQDVKKLAVGDKVFGFGWRGPKERAHQEFTTCSEYILGKVPENLTLQEAVTVPDNFVTAWHTITTHLGLPLPWPRPENYTAPHADDPLLIWGGSSSVGQFALQILKYYGYHNLLTTGSKQHHDYLKSIGAAQAFDYRDANVVDAILQVAAAAEGSGSGSGSSSTSSPAVPLIIDCIGSKSGSVAPIGRMAQKGAKVAVLLPVIIQDATDDVAPEYSMEVGTQADWAPGVDVSGVRTHMYLVNNPFAKEHLQPTVMPICLAAGIVTAQRQKIVEGKTLVERAQRAMDALRRRQVSGERLVWRVSDDEK
ncbi:MAG: hypothetical protein M1816_003837 [Peltula sp. TS41687]|nr:MAG: hypothetical protein M1816_003837 [Peltula sp. TS41687]